MRPEEAPEDYLVNIKRDNHPTVYERYKQPITEFKRLSILQIKRRSVMPEEQNFKLPKFGINAVEEDEDLKKAELEDLEAEMPDFTEKLIGSSEEETEAELKN